MAAKAKAYPIGTAGFGAVEVIDRAYGTCTDADKNANKFYSAEIHKDKGGKGYLVYVNYGRIGDARSTKKEYLLEGGGVYATEYGAREQYVKLLRSKYGKPKCSSCGNRSDEAGVIECSGCGRHYNFKDYTKKYVPVELAQAKVGSTAAQAIVDTSKLNTTSQANVTVSAPSAAPARPALHPRVAAFLEHIYAEAGRAVLSSVNTGALKASSDNPLGTLSQGQLDTGREIIDEIRQKLLDGGAGANWFRRMTSGYYNAIPQNVGRRPNWDALSINDMTKVSSAIDLLDLLGDVKGVQATFKGGSTAWDRYDAVGADISVLDSSDPVYREIEKNLTGTISRHHQRRFGRSKVRGIFKVTIKGQGGDFFDPDKVGNHTMMWHGSRNANMLGITSKGLLLRPPGAVITGSMFGNGLYFAPAEGRGACSSKSLQYAMGGWGGTQNKANNCYLFYCRIAQGRVREYYRAQSHLRFGCRDLKGYDSVRGVTGTSLKHDEHIIYTLRQHRIEYIVDVLPG